MKGHRAKNTGGHDHSQNRIYSIKLLPLLSQRIKQQHQAKPLHSLSTQGPQLDSSLLWDPQTTAYTSTFRCKPDTLGWFSVSISLVKLGFCEERKFGEVV